MFNLFLMFTFFIVINIVLDIEVYPTYTQEENYSSIGKLYMLTGAKASFKVRLLCILGGFLTTWIYLSLLKSIPKEEKELRIQLTTRQSVIACQSKFDSVYKGRVL
jgi:hypothetical protein